MEGIKSDLKLMASGDNRASDDDHSLQHAVGEYKDMIDLFKSLVG